MSRTVIQCGLGSDEITRVRQELLNYKRDFLKKVDIFRERLAEEIANIAAFDFGNSVVDDLLNGNTRQANVDMSYSSKGDITVVVASGEDAVWCEFGAGVYHNGGAGSSPHPKGAELNFTIGTYGKGYGQKQVWGYANEAGDIVLTHGTPATMPLYNAAQEVFRKAISIAKEVWG